MHFVGEYVINVYKHAQFVSTVFSPLAKTTKLNQAEPIFPTFKKTKGSLVSGGCSTPPLPLASPGNNLQIAGDQPLRPFLVPLEKEDETKIHLAHVF